jgi:hypothetical protein
MARDVLITPASGLVDFLDSSVSKASMTLGTDGILTLTGGANPIVFKTSTSGSSILRADGTSGTVFEITDDLSDSLMSVNTIAGLPVFEVFADNHIVAGRYNQNDFYLNTDGSLGLGTSAPSSVLDIYEQSGKDNKLRFHSSTTGSGTSNGSRIGLNGAELFINNIENSAIKIYTQSTQTNGITILGDGKVGIGTNSPNDKLEIYGNMRVRGSDGFGANTTASYNPSYVAYPGGGKAGSSSGTQAGYIKITLPQSWTNTMMQFSVDVFEYSENKTKTFKIAGYNYSPSGGSWHNASATVLAGNDSTTYRVEFGHDGSKCAIYISKGTDGASSSWVYPFIVVRDASFSFNSIGISNWIDGWDVSFSTATLSGITQTRDISTQVTGTGTSQYITKWNSTGTEINDSVIVQNVSNIGIGIANAQRLVTLYKASTPVLQLVNSTTGTGNSDGFLLTQTGLNTVIENSEAGYMAFRTTADEKMRIDASGHVGIGTDSPDSGLTIAKAQTSAHTYTTNHLHLATPATSNNGGATTISFATSTSDNYGWSLSAIRETINGNDTRFAFKSHNNSDSGSEVLSVLAEGSVGIGATTPTGKLQIGDNYTINASYGGDDIYIKGTTGRTSYDPNIYNTDDIGALITISDSDTVGPTKPGLVLYNDDVTAGGFSPMLLFSKRESGNSPYKATMAGIYARAPLGTGNSDGWIDGELIFATAGAASQGIKQRMVINKEGLVGIGTISPTTRLQVKDSVDNTYESGFSVVRSADGATTWINLRGGATNFNNRNNAGNAGLKYRWFQNSSEKMTLDTNGNLGIGTGSPECKLDIHDHTSATTFIADNNAGVRITNWGGSTGWSLLGFGGSSSTYTRNLSQIGSLSTSSGTYLAFGTSNNYNTGITNQAMTIDPSGEVGIGTIAPGYPLHVVGKIYSSTEGQFGNAIAKNNSGVATFGSNSTATTIKINLDASASRNDLVIEGSTGDVGIGTASPAEKLHIGSGASENSNLFVRVDGDAAFQKGFNIFADGSEQWRIYTTASSSDLRFYDGSNVTVTFKDGGNVGVNTTSPTSKLQVVGSTSGDSVLKIDGTNGTLFEVVDDLSDSLMSVNDAAGLPVFEVFADNTIIGGRYNQNDFYLNTSGNLGLGTSSPITKLNIKGDQSANGQLYIEPKNDGEYAGLVIKTTRGADRTYAIFAGGTGTDDLNFRFRDASAGADRMVIDSTGKVGIGTTGPSDPLHVIGYIKSSIGFKAGNYTTMLESGNESVFGNTAYYGVLFKTNNATRMKITNAGDVGIGTDPVEKLDINGNLNIDTGTGFSRYLFLEFDQTADETWVKLTLPQDSNSTNNGGSVKVRVNWLGKHATFGASQEHLITYASNHGSSGYPYFSDIHAISKTFRSASYAPYAPSSTPDVIFYTVGSAEDALYFKVKGYHSSYNKKRQVSVEINGRTVTSPVLTHYGNTSPTSPSSIAKAIEFNTTGHSYFNGGNVGIGTTIPSTKLQVAGTSQFDGDLTVANSTLTITAAAPNLLFAVPSGGLDSRIFNDGSGSFIIGHGTNSNTPTERLRIDSSGNVGIGAASPSQKLHVEGSLRLTAAFYDSNNATGTSGQVLTSTGSATDWKNLDQIATTPNAPASASATIVGETVDVTFAASTTSNIDAYLVYSSIDGSDYGLISVIPPEDFSSSMSVIDNSFNETGTQAYRVYAMKLGVLSSAATASVSYTVSSAEPTSMNVVDLNNAFYVQWNPPSSNERFITAYNVYKDENAVQASLSRSNATLIYSGLNTNYMYQINGTNNNNFHQFWVETTIA